MPVITLPPYRKEVPYVLVAHRDLPPAEQPVFWYEKPGLEELAGYFDNSTQVFVRKGGDREERTYQAHMMVTVLQRHLLRVERLFEEDGATPITIPAPTKGSITAERRLALNRLPRDWQLELVNAIVEGQDSTEALAKN